MKEEVKETPQEVVEPKGRDAFLAMYKSDNPDAGDIDDNSLWENAHNRHLASEKRYGELEGKYNQMNEANDNLSKTILKDPKVAMFMQMLGEGKSFPYAHGRSFGKEGYGLEGEQLDAFEKGYQENLASLAESEKAQAEAQKNISESLERLKQFGEGNKLSDEQQAGLQEALMQFSENVLMGNLSDGLIDMVYKGLNYDRDVEDAARTGEIEGKNATIEEKKFKKEDLGVPNLSAASKQGVKPIAAPKKKDFYDSFESVKY